MAKDTSGANKDVSKKDDRVSVEGQPIPSHAPRVVGNIFQGPLPPPEMLAEYDRVSPGCGRTIVEMAVGQSNHRQRMESRLLWFDGFNRLSGQIAAVVIVLFGIWQGANLIAQGKDGAGLIAGAIPLAGVALAYIFTGKAPRSPEEQ